MKVIAIVVHSLDGFIAKTDSELINWSSREDKAMFAKETKKAGVVIMGLKTFQTLPHPLKDRLNIILTSKPVNYQTIPSQVEFVSTAPQQLTKDLQKRGYKKVFLIGGSLTFTNFLKEKLIDEIWVSIEPLIFGQGITTFTEKLEGVSCSLIKTKKLNKNTVQLKYQINYF